MRTISCARIAWRAGLAASLLLACLAPPVVAATTAFTSGAAEVRGFLARSSTTVFAAAYGGGLYTSTNSGSTWSRVSLTSSNERYLTSIGGPNAGYFLVGAEEGLFRTTTGTANSFTRVLAEPITAIAVAPSDSTKVLVAVKGVGILRSTDSGVTFTLANNTAFDSTDMTAVAFHPTNANTAYAASWPDGVGNRGGVFRSTDGGATWTAHTTPPDRHVTSVTVDSGGTVYIGVLRPSDGGGDVYRQVGGAGSWLTTGDPFGVVSLHRDANTATTIWAGARYLGLRSGSGATFNYTFAGDANPNLFYTAINAVATFPGNTAVVLKAIKGAGVWRSSAVATPRTWTRVSFPGADRVLSASGVGGAPSSMLMGLYAGGVWRSNDSGSTWFPPTVNAGQADFSFAAFAVLVNPFVSIWELAASPTSGSTIYAAAGGVGMFYANDNPGLFRFNGTSWGGVGNNVTTEGFGVAPWNGVNEAGITVRVGQVYGVSLNRGNDAIAYSSYLTPGGVFRRSGANWTQSIPPGVTPQIRAVATSVNASKLLAMPFDDKPSFSLDGGASWGAQIAISQAGFERMRFFSASENPANGNQWVAGTNKGVYYSADAGNNWTRVTMAGVFENHPIPAVAFHPSSGRAFAGDFEGNMYCSANGGVNWVKQPGKLNAGIRAIRAIGSSIYYLTDGAGMHREDGSC
ncbi:MAG: hypothetical protein KF776_16280 [Burkholderiales bacterium]|nr:hypothetical protein [Burkholderiales bacterium]